MGGADALPLAAATVAVAAAIALLVLLARAGPAALIAPRPSSYLNVLLVGALGSGAVALLAVLAMTGTSATNRGLFQAMYPVATALAARLLLGERLSPAAYGIIALMTVGLLAMNSGASGLELGLPFFFLLATLPLIGLADVYARRTLHDADPGFVTTGRLVAGALLLLLTVPLSSAEQWRTLLQAWPWVLGAGLATAAGLLGLYRAMGRFGASLAAAFASLAPVLTLSSEWLVLDARFSLLQLGGLVVVVAGAVMLAWRL